MPSLRPYKGKWGGFREVGWSAMAYITIAMAIIAQVAANLPAKGQAPPVFVSPNVPGIPADNTDRAYEEYERRLKR